MRITKRQLRQIIKTSLLEARARRTPPDLGAINKRNKPYIMSDADLFYWLRQNNNPLSVDHYSMEPARMPEAIIDLVNDRAFLKGFRCVGRVSTYMNGYAVYLFADQNDYTVVCRNHTTGGLIVAGNIPRSEYELLVEVTEYMRKMKSGNIELDSYISKY